MGRISEDSSCFKRLAIVYALASKHIIVPISDIMRWFLGSVKIPPPVDIIKLSPATASNNFLFSRSLKVDSPRFEKICLRSCPISRLISSSISKNLQFISSATLRPTVVLPVPEKPVKNTIFSLIIPKPFVQHRT